LPVFVHWPPASVHANVPVWHSTGAHGAPDTHVVPFASGLVAVSATATSRGVTADIDASVASDRVASVAFGVDASAVGDASPSTGGGTS
jgi:hypothetical protein